VLSGLQVKSVCQERLSLVNSDCTDEVCNPISSTCPTAAAQMTTSDSQTGSVARKYYEVCFHEMLDYNRLNQCS